MVPLFFFTFYRVVVSKVTSIWQPMGACVLPCSALQPQKYTSGKREKKNNKAHKSPYQSFFSVLFLKIKYIFYIYSFYNSKYEPFFKQKHTYVRPTSYRRAHGSRRIHDRMRDPISRLSASESDIYNITKYIYIYIFEN